MASASDVNEGKNGDNHVQQARRVPFEYDTFPKSQLGDSKWEANEPGFLPGQPLLARIINPDREEREEWQCLCALAKPEMKDSDEVTRAYKFIHEQLCVGRLDSLVQPKFGLGLWLAGYKGYIGPLWKQKIRGREIVVTQQTDLHLVWWKNQIYLKPLPLFLMDYGSFDRYLCQAEIVKTTSHTNKVCLDSQELHKAGLGLLMTYTKLIQYPSDLQVAHEAQLLPKTVTWTTWSLFAKQIIEYINQRNHTTSVSSSSSQSLLVSPRYTYGELRLNRLNIVHRFLWRGWRGYFVGYSDYATFLGDNFGWLIVLFLWLTTALTAMQVATATTDLDAVVRVSYWFSVVTLIIIAAALGAIMVVCAVVFVKNAVFAIYGLKKRRTRENEKGKKRPFGLSRKGKEKLDGISSIGSSAGKVTV